jgi:hypothetical protein
VDSNVAIKQKLNIYVDAATVLILYLDVYILVEPTTNPEPLILKTVVTINIDKTFNLPNEDAFTAFGLVLVINADGSCSQQL